MTLTAALSLLDEAAGAPEGPLPFWVASLVELRAAALAADAARNALASGLRAVTEEDVPPHALPEWAAGELDGGDAEQEAMAAFLRETAESQRALLRTAGRVRVNFAAGAADMRAGMGRLASEVRALRRAIVDGVAVLETLETAQAARAPGEQSEYAVHLRPIIDRQQALLVAWPLEDAV